MSLVAAGGGLTLDIMTEKVRKKEGKKKVSRKSKRVIHSRCQSLRFLMENVAGKVELKNASQNFPPTNTVKTFTTQFKSLICSVDSKKTGTSHTKKRDWQRAQERPTHNIMKKQEKRKND